jgi:hypothetical protein
MPTPLGSISSSNVLSLPLPTGLRPLCGLTTPRHHGCNGLDQHEAAAPSSCHAVKQGFLPTSQILSSPEMLYLAVGIVGATVMPHNLYLHSSIVQTRQHDRCDVGIRQAIRYATLDSNIALGLALFVNGRRPLSRPGPAEVLRDDQGSVGSTLRKSRGAIEPKLLHSLSCAAQIGTGSSASTSLGHLLNRAMLVDCGLGHI